MGIDFIANIPKKGNNLSDLMSASDLDIFEVLLQVLQLKTPISEKELYSAAAELYGVETLTQDALRALKKGIDLIPEDRYFKDGSRYYSAESLKEKSTLSLDLLDLDFEIEGAQEAKKKGIVDIIFVIDITGSMGPAIKQITHNISQFIENINQTRETNKIIRLNNDHIAYKNNTSLKAFCRLLLFIISLDKK
mgnify:CR=1 FL=1